MAEKLVKCYDFVKAEAGVAATMRLAMLTAVPANKAAEQPDSPDLLTKFRNAVKDITGKNAPV